MPNITWLGNSFFARNLKRPGVNLHIADCPAGSHMGWEDVCAIGGTPDILVVGDKSQSPFVLGIENFPCLTALYVVDSHIHSWFPYYAQAFDLCLVSLKDHLPLFYDKRLQPDQIFWFPPYYDGEPLPPDVAATQKKLWDILFVGTLNPFVNPERIEWMNKFRALEPRLHTACGPYRELNAQARLILNHSIAGDLNFRVVETLGTGVPLLSPRLKHGLEDLFSDGEDLFMFDQADIPGAAKMAKELLNQPEKMLETAWNGQKKVTAGHLPAHRADKLLKIAEGWFASGKAAQLIAQRLKSAPEIRKKHLRLIYLLLAESLKEFPNMQKAYLAAASKSD